MPTVDNGDSSDPKRNPNLPTPERPPLLKKSKTIAAADDPATAVFPGPLFPAVRRGSNFSPAPLPPSFWSSSWSPRRSFDSSDSTSSVTSDTFPGQAFGFADRDYVYLSILGPNTTQNRVTAVKSSPSKSQRKQSPSAPSPVRSASMPSNLDAAAGKREMELVRRSPSRASSPTRGLETESEREVKTVK